MRKIYFSLFFLLLLQPAFAQEGFHFGAGLTYNTDSLMRALGGHVKLSGSVSEKLVIHGMGTYYFRKGTYYALDADLHYQLINFEDKFRINPFAGLNLTRTTKTNTSLNLGISFLIFNNSFHYYIEPKFIVDDSQFVISIGIML